MVTEASVVPAIELRNNSCCWSVSVAAAESRKAEDASEETRRTPSPSSFTGKLAWSREVKITDDADAFSKQAVEHRQTWVVDAR